MYFRFFNLSTLSAVCVLQGGLAAYPAVAQCMAAKFVPADGGVQDEYG